MSNMKWHSFGDAEGTETRDYIDSLTHKMRITRKELAENHLNVSGRTLQGWMTRNEIPERYYKELQNLSLDSKPADKNQKPHNSSLEAYSDGELIAELIRRGIKITLGG